jgi:hypothetical protein
MARGMAIADNTAARLCCLGRDPPIFEGPSISGAKIGMASGSRIRLFHQ